MQLRVSGLRRVLDGDRELFRGLSFDLRRGEALFVSGPSGVGKTLLLRCIAALDEAQVRHMAGVQCACTLVRSCNSAHAWLGGRVKALEGQARRCMAYSMAWAHAWVRGTDARVQHGLGDGGAHAWVGETGARV